MRTQQFLSIYFRISNYIVRSIVPANTSRHMAALPLPIFLILAGMPSAAQILSANSAASALLGQVSGAFSSNPVQAVRLSGNATLILGSLKDTGTADLTVSANGSSSMQLALAASGQHTETSTVIGLSASCTWSGSDGLVNQDNSSGCQRPVPWFLPAFSLQQSILSSSLEALDLGAGTVGSSGNIYRHLLLRFSPDATGGASASAIAGWSVTDVGFDSTTFLPAVLSYSATSDSGASDQVAIEIRYLNYQLVDGVAIPFQIQRFVNGALQLDIQITSAQIN
jgi:hypothetical protein